MQIQAKKPAQNKFHNVIIWFTGTITCVLLGAVILSAFMH